MGSPQARQVSRSNMAEASHRARRRGMRVAGVSRCGQPYVRAEGHRRSACRRRGSRRRGRCLPNRCDPSDPRRAAGRAPAPRRAAAPVAGIRRLRRELPDDRIVWASHNAMFGQIGRVDRTFLMLNIALHGDCVRAVPAHLVAEHLRHEGAEAAAILYGATMIGTAGGFAATWFSARAAAQAGYGSADGERHLAVLSPRRADPHARDAVRAHRSVARGLALRRARRVLRVRELAVQARLSGGTQTRRAHVLEA
jgi:hypothetical protein